MKKEEYINKLIFELPDYIKSKIDNPELKKKIKNEINSNPEFRKEYEDLKNSLSFLKNTKLSEPPDHYFSTLLPKINAKLEKHRSTSEISIWEKIFSYWKFAIPLVPIVLIFLIFKFDIFSPGNNLKVEENSNNVIVKEKSNNEIESTENKDIAVIQEDSSDESVKTVNKQRYNYNYTNENNYEDNISSKETPESDNESTLNEYLDGMDSYYEDNEDFTLEEDFNSLDKDQQDEIIQKLKEADF